MREGADDEAFEDEQGDEDEEEEDNEEEEAQHVRSETIEVGLFTPVHPP